MQATSSTYKYKLQLDAEVKSAAAAETTPTVESGEEPKGDVPPPATPTKESQEDQKEEGETEIEAS